MSLDEAVHILVVDDSPAKVLALSALLEAPEIVVVTAPSGEEALRLLLRRDFAVILLDVSMPVLDGFDTASMIRQRPNTATTPIIFITAYDNSEERVGRAYALGAVDFIFAPIMPEVLKAKVAVFVELFRKTRQVRQQASELEQRVRERTAALEAEVEERLRAENELVAKLHHLDTLSAVSSAIVEAADPVLALERLVEVIQARLQCDRVWLVDASRGDASIRFRIERAGHALPERRDVGGAICAWLEAVVGTPGALVEVARRNGQGRLAPVAARSQLAVCVRPRQAGHWMLVLQQCSYPREWLAEERSLVEDVALRVADAVTHLIGHEELQASEQRFRLIAELQPQFVWSAQPDGRVDYVNPGWCQYTGLSAEQSVGWGWTQALHPDELDEAVALWRDAVATGREHEIQLRFRQHDGAFRWHIVRASPMRGAAGEIVRWFGASADIQDQRRTEEALRQSRARYQALVDSIDGIVWEAELRDAEADTPKGRRYVLVSPQAVPLLGYPIAAWTEDPLFWQEQVHVDDRDRVVTLARVAIDRGDETFEAEYRMRSASGTVVWLHDYVTVVRTDGVPVQLRGVMVDQTERKLAEQALRRTEDQFRHAQKMEAVGRLAGGIAHDFNNLLTAINGYSDMLLRNVPADSEMRPFLEEIHAAGDRAANLTRQLLAYSRKQMLSPKTVNINAIVGEMDRMLRRVIGEHIELLTLLATDVNPVKVDPGQMQQVLLNLVVNARDAMPKGGKLTIETANVDLGPASEPNGRGGLHVRITVTDTGKGMDDHVKQHVFEPFFTTKKVGEGTGLGLSTVYGIIDQSGGVIAVESEPDRGARFEVLLPALPLPAIARPGAKEPEDVLRGRETLLVVEDESAVRRMVSFVLRGAGYRVLDAACGADALVLSAEFANEIDLLLTDVVMPGMNGHELAGRVAEARPGICVIFMSGYMDDEVVRHGVSQEGNTFLHKPFSPARVAAAVRQVLDARKAAGAPVPATAIASTVVPPTPPAIAPTIVTAIEAPVSPAPERPLVRQA